MKNKFFVVLGAFAIMTLASCSNQIDFQDNLKLGEKLTDKEQKEIAKSVKERFLASLTNYDDTYASAKCAGNAYKYLDKYNEEKKEMERNITFYKLTSESIITKVESNLKEEIKKAGVSYQTNSSYTNYEVCNFSEGKRITYSTTKDSEKEKSTVYSGDNSKDILQVVDNQWVSDKFDYDFFDFEKYPVYRYNNGYMFVYSDIEKEVVDVTWGNETRTETTTVKTQMLYEIDADYFVTKVKYVSESYTNHIKYDWYDKDILSQKVSEETTFSHQGKKDFDKEEIKGIYNPYVLSGSIVIKNSDLQLTAVSDTFTNADISKRHLKALFSLDELSKDTSYTFESSVFYIFKKDYLSDSESVSKDVYLETSNDSFIKISDDSFTVLNDRSLSYLIVELDLVTEGTIIEVQNAKVSVE